MDKHKARAKRLAEQLGISQGAANHRLRKQLLYKYIKLANEHFCYKCGAEIEAVDDFSIEHKEPWENRDVNLFWSLDNIAFSHLGCNQPHVQNNGSQERRRIGPEGTNWCHHCKQFLPNNLFGIDKTRWNGLRNTCKSCWKYVRNKH